MRAAVHRVDVVGKAEHRLRVAVVVLQGDLDLDVIARSLHDDGLLVQHLLAAIQMLDKLGNSAGVLELCAPGFAGLGIRGALIGQSDLEALVQEGHLAETLRQRVVIELGGGKNALVGQKVYLGAAPLAGSRLAQLAGGSPATEVHLPGVPVAPDLHVELLAQRVHAAHAHAVQAAGNLVGRGVELAAGMELGEHHLHGRHHLAVAHGHQVHRDAAPVIDHRDGVVHVNDYVDFLAIAGQGLVHGIVHHLVDQMVQSHLAG